MNRDKVCPLCGDDHLHLGECKISSLKLKIRELIGHLPSPDWEKLPREKCNRCNGKGYIEPEQGKLL